MDRERDGKGSAEKDVSFVHTVRCLWAAKFVHMNSHAGMPVTSVRELRVLQQCCHPNLVELKKVVTGRKLDR
jgi:hypothetical protein